ncbi:MAG TPA: hypothetical protein VI776_16235, partial [Anaerolineales bacterium]|nr:hypothetical protein [Anaerolineales bacterium]
MKDMRSNVSYTLLEKPWLLAAAGLAIGLVCFGSVAGSRVLTHLAPKPGNLRPVAIQLTPAPPTCSGPSLTLGTASFQVQSIVLPAQGELAVPPNSSGTAFWVEGTQENPVFLLGPGQENQALAASLQAGDPAEVVWENCNTASYTLAAPEAYPADPAALLDQPEAQLTVLVPPGPAGPGYAVHGSLQGEVLLAIPTQSPDEPGVQAEISLLEAKPSADGASFEVSVSIYNYGGEPFQMTAADVALLPAVGS